MKRYPFVPTVLVLVVIVYLSLAEQPVDPNKVHLFEGADKVVHGCMYMALTMVGCFDCFRLSGRRSWLHWLFVVLGAMAIGGVMEWLQGTITIARSADVIDFVANCCGALVGLLPAWLFAPWVYRRLCRRG